LNHKFSKSFISPLARTNRLISGKTASWNFAPPFDFASEILARRALARGAHSSALTTEKSRSPLWCAIFDHARTFFEKL
jgi:hypothetical protein